MDMTQRFQQYLGEHFVNEDATLRFVREQTAAQGLPLISLQPHEGKLLYLLAKLAGVERAVEIGTLAGYSGIWLARALPSHGKLFTIEYDRLHAKIARAHFVRAGLADKVTLLQGDGLQMLRRLAADAPYDLLFIDADKVNYSHYLEWAAAHLRRGGLVLAHNALRGGAIFQPQSDDDFGIVEFNRALAAQPHFSSTILEVGDGLALGLKTS